MPLENDLSESLGSLLGILSAILVGMVRRALVSLTRHRLASFDVQLQWYVKLTDWREFFPESVMSISFARDAENLVRQRMGLYQRMVEADIPAEDACCFHTRLAIRTRLVMTMNDLSLRCCNRAQLEVRHRANEMLKLCRQRLICSWVLVPAASEKHARRRSSAALPGRKETGNKKTRSI